MEIFWPGGDGSVAPYIPPGPPSHLPWGPGALGLLLPDSFFPPQTSGHLMQIGHMPLGFLDPGGQLMIQLGVWGGGAAIPPFTASPSMRV